MEKQQVIELKGITKIFGRIVANRDCNLSLYNGEILSLLGENGSGKTTLMNALAGIYCPDAGDIYVRGEKVKISSPHNAYKYHIGMVHQHFKLVDVFSAAENIVLGLDKKDYANFAPKPEEKEKELQKIKKAKENLEALKRERKEQINRIKSDKEAQKQYADYSQERITWKDFAYSLIVGLMIATCFLVFPLFLGPWLIKKLDDKAVNAVEDEYHEKIKAADEELEDCKNRYKAMYSFNIKGAASRVKDMCKRYGFELDPYKKVYNMTVSEKQTLEIIKALYRGVDILILDEPTAVLTPQEIEKLFDVLRAMRADGKSIIIITHKLNEVLEISDRVAVLCKGEVAGDILTKDATEKILTEMMVGHKVDLNINRTEIPTTGERLIVQDLSLIGRDGRKVLKNINFTVYGSEILGIAGISGSGQKELLETIAGLNRNTQGTIIFHNPKKEQPVTFFHKNIKQIRELAAQDKFHLKGKKEPLSLVGKTNKEITEMVNKEQIIFYEDEIMDLKGKKPIEIRDLGIKLSFVPEDRLGMGLVGNMDLIDNMMLRSFRKGKGGIVHRNKPAALAKELVDELEIKTPSLHTSVKKLSGGNIQKVLVGREISTRPKVLMVAYPVRGLDINSSYMIYNLINKQKEKGSAVIYVGEDLDVILALCDRVLVLRDGEVAGILNCKDTNKNEIGLLMTKKVEERSEENA